SINSLYGMRAQRRGSSSRESTGARTAAWRSAVLVRYLSLRIMTSEICSRFVLKQDKPSRALVGSNLSNCTNMQRCCRKLRQTSSAGTTRFFQSWKLVSSFDEEQ